MGEESLMRSEAHLLKLKKTSQQAMPERRNMMSWVSLVSLEVNRLSQMRSWKNEHHNNHWWTFRQLHKCTVLKHLPWWEWLFCPHCTKTKYTQTSCSEQLKTRTGMHVTKTWRHQPPTSLSIANVHTMTANSCHLYLSSINTHFPLYFTHTLKMVL